MSTNKRTPKAFRSSLNETLRKGGHSPITDSEWRVIEERGHPRHFEDGEIEAVEDALTFIRDARRARGQHGRQLTSPPEAAPRPSASAWQSRALSELFASHAIHEDAGSRFGIADFRRDVLGEQLLARADAGPWVTRTAAKEGKATVTDLPGPYGTGFKVHLLAYAIDGDQWAQHIPVVIGGALDKLRNVSERLAKFYGWADAQASFFVLTGSVPWVSAISQKVQWKSPLTARQRITLDIHPTCTPQDVARAYADVRKEHYGRLRRLSPKHAMLGAFYAAQSDDAPPGELRLQWNERCVRERWPTSWQYKRADTDLFHRDARRAVERLSSVGQTAHPRTMLPPASSAAKRQRRPT